MVREGGLEPPHPKAPDPKSGASANSATPARGLYSVRNSPQGHIPDPWIIRRAGSLRYLFH